jgi:hypothetical protein
MCTSMIHVITYQVTPTPQNILRTAFHIMGRYLKALSIAV